MLARIALFLLLSMAAAAQPADPLARAEAHLYNLEYPAALQTINGFLNQHPDDLRTLNLLGVTLLRQEMFRQGLLRLSVYGDDGAVYKPAAQPLPAGFDQQLSGLLDRAQKIAERRLAANSRDADALYWAGAVHSTRAMYLFTLRRSWLGALGEAKRANHLHQQLLTLEPNNTDALLVVGLENYVVGSLPWPIKVLASLAGTSGDKKRGLEQLERCASAGGYASQDARFVLPVLLVREHRSADALKLLHSLAGAYPRNFLLRQEIGKLEAVASRQSAVASHQSPVVSRQHLWVVILSEAKNLCIVQKEHRSLASRPKPGRSLRVTI